MPRTTNLTKSLQNDKVSLSWDIKGKSITGSDLNDQNNLPCFYSKSKRGLAGGWAALEAVWKDDKRRPLISMYGAMEILFASGVRCHSYCAMD